MPVSYTHLDVYKRQATGYEFADNVTATVSGNTATSVTKNAADDTLTCLLYTSRCV